MVICSNTMSAISSTVFKDAHQEDETLRMWGISPTECAFPLSIPLNGDTDHPTKQKTTQSPICKLSSAPGPQLSLMHRGQWENLQPPCSSSVNNFSAQLIVSLVTRYSCSGGRGWGLMMENCCSLRVVSMFEARWAGDIPSVLDRKMLILQLAAAGTSDSESRNVKGWRMRHAGEKRAPLSPGLLVWHFLLSS